MKLPPAFYLNPDVVDVAKQLLGKMLITRFDGKQTSGWIVETEAYAGIVDKASHAFGGRLTERTRTMYARGGVAYVYLCYGMHSLFNVVTHQEGIPHAVLIRAIEPAEGMDLMMKRRGKSEMDYSLTAGPGSLSKALGIQTLHTGQSLQSNSLWIEDAARKIEETSIIASPRVGVAYAQEDALLPYRFRIQGNCWVSKAK
ncbi:MAG: DNA-3-methyladenine glycosylase [Bacteroidia bacterium]|jgi:DNA-3-methyladenine glycosylase